MPRDTGPAVSVLAVSKDSGCPKVWPVLFLGVFITCALVMLFCETPATELRPKGISSLASKRHLPHPTLLWPHDPQCHQYYVQFGRGLPLCLLLSYPRSGNTWSRYLLEAASGLYTGSVYFNNILFRQGFLGEKVRWRGGTTLVQKTHREADVGTNDSVILLVRNPSRSCVSYFVYNSIKSKNITKFTGSIAKDRFASEDFHRHISRCALKWESLALAGLKNRKLLPIYYEKLREDPVAHVRLMLRFLKVDLDEERLSCLERHMEGRAMGAQPTIDPYTAEEKRYFADVVTTVDKKLRERGFAPLPDYSLYVN